MEDCLGVWAGLERAPVLTHTLSRQILTLRHRRSLSLSPLLYWTLLSIFVLLPLASSLVHYDCLLFSLLTIHVRMNTFPGHPHCIHSHTTLSFPPLKSLTSSCFFCFHIVSSESLFCLIPFPVFTVPSFITSTSSPFRFFLLLVNPESTTLFVPFRPFSRISRFFPCLYFFLPLAPGSCSPPFLSLHVLSQSFFVRSRPRMNRMHPPHQEGKQVPKVKVQKTVLK